MTFPKKRYCLFLIVSLLLTGCSGQVLLGTDPQVSAVKKIQ